MAINVIVQYNSGFLLDILLLTLSVEIAYTEPRMNHGTMILHRVSYSAYTLRHGSYYTYGIAPSSQPSMTFSGLLCDAYLEW